jgi:hypothetical protein
MADTDPSPPIQEEVAFSQHASPPERDSVVRRLAWLEPFGLPLAFLVDTAAAFYLVLQQWLLAAVVLGLLTTLAGVVGLWRLHDSPGQAPARLTILATVMVAAGPAGIAVVATYHWTAGRGASTAIDAPQATPQAAAPGPSAPAASTGMPSAQGGRPEPGPASGSGPIRASENRPSISQPTQQPSGTTPARASTPPAASKRFLGTVGFRPALFGSTVAGGGSISGDVTQWSAGFQIWLFARAEGTETAVPQGPCPVTDHTWTCSNLSLPGTQGTREFLDVVVASDAEAATYTTLTTVPPASAHDDSQIYKG